MGAVLSNPPVQATSALLAEAQWEQPFARGRRQVTAYLGQTYDGTPILASMGSLGHYMQESASIGLGIRNFVHEGNGDLWTAALAERRRLVRWILVEENAEGGDMLFMRAQKDPKFFDGLVRVAEGGGLALYERRP